MILYEVGSGKPYATIQDAVDAITPPLSDYHKIKVYDGVYSGFTIAGKGSNATNYITIEVNEGDSVIITSDVVISTPHVYVSGLDITMYVLFGAGSDNGKLLNCILRDFYFGYYAQAYSVEIASGVKDVLVDACLFHTSTNGIWIRGNIGNRVENCVFREIDNDAINTGSGNQAPYIINNTIAKCGTGIRFRADQQIRIRNNNITHNVNGIVLDGATTPDNSIKASNNVWNNTTNYTNTSGGIDANSFNPLYVNYGNNDFRIQELSPCIDKGIIIDAPDHDFDGTSRPRLTGFDIGAFEYSTTNVAPSLVINSVVQRTDGTGKVDIGYVGYDQNYDLCSLNLYEYSMTGAFAGEEQAMTPSSTDVLHDGTENLHFEFSGTTLNFVWDSFADLGEGIEETTVYIRLRAYDGEYNSNPAVSSGNVDTASPTITSFYIDPASEVEEGVTLTGVVDLQIAASGNVTSMKFSNDGEEWTSYEPFATTKSSWNLINGYGAQPFQGKKTVYIKVKDSYGNETDGTLYDSTWYKLTDASVENLTTTTKYHTIAAAIAAASVNDILEIQTDDTFFEGFTIDKDGITVRVAEGFKPTLDMKDKQPIIIDNAEDVTIEGFIFIQPEEEAIQVVDSTRVTILLNEFEGEKAILIDPSTDIVVTRNIFINNDVAIVVADSVGTKITNNEFLRMTDMAVRLNQSPSKVVNNTFVKCENCIENLMPNDDQSTVRNNIFYDCPGVAIDGNALWIIEKNNFWETPNRYTNVVDLEYDKVNFSFDPGFANEAVDNYYLKEESLCVNRGTLFDAPVDDFSGTERPQDSGVDIGAHEYFPVPDYVYDTTNILQNEDVKAVFIYDTSKDENQAWVSSPFTSWQAEAGNFPEMAFLITTDEGLYIANAENNELWMKFESGVDNAIDGDSEISAVFALNGIIYVSKGSNAGQDGGLVMIDLINDEIRNLRTNGFFVYDGNISQRNDGEGYSPVYGQYSTFLIGNAVKLIKGQRIEGVDVIAVGTENGISVIRTEADIIDYAIGAEIKNLVLTSTGTLYYVYTDDSHYIGSDKIGVFYGVSEATQGENTPAYSYGTFSQPRTLSNTINDLVVMEEESKVIRSAGQRSSLLYVASDEGLTLINTNEIDPGNGELWGYSHHFGLKTTTNPDIKYKVFEGDSSDFFHIGVHGEIFIVVAKDAEDTLYIYNRRIFNRVATKEIEGDDPYTYNEREFNARFVRTTSLPSRNISSLDFVEKTDE